MTRARVALAFTVAGLVLAGVAVVTRDRVVTWVAIFFTASAVLLRWLARRHGAGGDRS